MNTDMYIARSPISDQIVKQLSELLGLKLSRVQWEDLEPGAPATVCFVSAFDTMQTRYRLVLKMQEDRTAFRLYTHYLKPFNLHSPKEYGYIDIEGQAFLVMDYIEHTPPDWSDSLGYMRAVKWLIEKDFATLQHLDSLRHLDCFGIMRYFGTQYWIAELEKWSHVSPPAPHARQVLTLIQANQSRIDACIEELHSVGPQTVVHGDLHLSNVLFGKGEFENDVFVIDWTQPHIGSVTQDLASLYDNAPHAIKEELISVYREQIDFRAFDELFAKAKLLRDIGYFTWMAEMIGTKAQEVIDRSDQNELGRVMQSIVLGVEASDA